MTTQLPMQSKDPYWLIQIFGSAAQCGFYLAILVVAIVGWRRKKHLGHMVLAMWAGLSIFWIPAAHLLQPLFVRIMTNATGGNTSTAWFLMTNLLSSLGLSSILLCGLALLVFNPAPPR